MQANKTKKEQNLTVANKFLNGVAQLADNLAARWEDESEYEDINEYQAVLQKAAKEYGISITYMSKCPFGFSFKTPYGKARVTTSNGEISLLC